MKPQISDWCDIIYLIIPDSLWRWYMPPPFPDFSLCPASWTLSCCHSTLTSLSSSICRCHWYTSLDFQCIVLCYWFQLVWSSGNSCWSSPYPWYSTLCFVDILSQRWDIESEKDLVPGLIPVENMHDSVIGFDPAGPWSALITTFWHLSVR